MKLGELISAWREVNGCGVREAAKQIGISPATLSRIENDKDPDYNSFVKLLDWLLKK